MLRSITLVNYQSHQQTRLELGPFTVVVGSSSSGKSALVRALRLVAENARGVTYVRQGTKQARVSLELVRDEGEQPTVVSIARGKGVSEYELFLPGAVEPTVFTKCGTSVPDALSDVMGFGDSNLWIAGQFDRPYLLDETGSQVAAVLGKLTNVTMIFAAVRECNRRAAEAGRRFKDAAGELSSVKATLREHLDLPRRKAAGLAAEEALERASSLSGRRQLLVRRIEALGESEARAVAARASSVTVPVVTDLLALDARRTRLRALVGAVGEAAQRRDAVSSALRSAPEAQSLALIEGRRASLRIALADAAESHERRRRLADESSRADAALDAAREEFAESLRRAGSCPLCGASATHAQIDHVV